jgi:hypothetical protein
MKETAVTATGLIDVDRMLMIEKAFGFHGLGVIERVPH